VAILVADGFEQVEMTKPREALDEAGAQTKIVSLKPGKIQGMNHADKGDKFDVDLTVDQARPEQFDALLILGGLLNPDAMRTKRAGTEFRAPFLSREQTGGGHLSWPPVVNQRGYCSRKENDFLAGNSGGHA
jgi:protease I